MRLVGHRSGHAILDIGYSAGHDSVGLFLGILTTSNNNKCL